MTNQPPKLGRGVLILAIASIFAFGCGSAPPPTARMASTGAAIRAASEVGAQSDPKAALHLKLAQEQRDKAEALMKDGKNEEAEGLLMRAEADAELALALARSAQMKAQAEKAIEEVQELKKKLGGNS
ncbi:MAG: DUF4398 domain-containing protein [Deltaproteobacteria bacterium]|nr:DUF4398 domain-containing protein [Deltaproteobacteria bacterium]